LDYRHHLLGDASILGELAARCCCSGQSTVCR